MKDLYGSAMIDDPNYDKLNNKLSHLCKYKSRENISKEMIRKCKSIHYSSQFLLT